MSDAFFSTEDGRWFQPTPVCRGPWHRDHCHAGPPTGLAARALAELVPAQTLRRLTIELLRPVPMAGFTVVAALNRSGRTVSTGAGELVDAEGKLCARFAGLLVAPVETELSVDLVPAASERAMGAFAESRPGGFPIDGAAHGETFFPDAVEVRYPPGHSPSPGATQVWMHAPRLLADEPGRGFERIAPLADCGNAFARQCDPFAPMSFANADLTIALHREPQGEWFGMDAHSHWQPDGVGLSDAQLFDTHGPVGRALQTIVLRRSDS